MKKTYLTGLFFFTLVYNISARNLGFQFPVAKAGDVIPAIMGK